MREGFILLRRGLQEHLADGRLSPLDYAFYVCLLMLADPATGIVKSNAARLAYEMNCSQRVARRHLERLSANTKKREPYIYRVPTRRSKLPYPILIDRYLCTKGAYTNKYLNAAATEDWKAPVYESGPREGRRPGPTAGGPVRNKSSYVETRNEKQTPPAQRAGALSPGPRNGQQTEIEKRRRIEARDRREQRETHTRKESQVGQGPQAGPLTEDSWRRRLQRYEMHDVDENGKRQVACDHCEAYVLPGAVDMSVHQRTCPKRPSKIVLDNQSY